MKAGIYFVEFVKNLGKKQLMGWIVIIILSLIDFFLVRQVILYTNASHLSTVLGALPLSLALELGPTFLGIGIVEFFDKIRFDTGTGRLRTILFMTVGGLCTVVCFLIYAYIRSDSIIAKGGFVSNSYLGYHGDLVLLAGPYLTSFMAFLISLFCLGSDTYKDACNEFETAQRAYVKALHEFDMINIEFENTLGNLWSQYYENQEIPENPKEAIMRIRTGIHQEIEPRLNVLLQNILNESNLIIPFMLALKEIYRDYAQNPDFLAMVDLNEFKPDSKVARRFDEFKKYREKTIKEIVGNL